jgi:hypothetical protein
VAEADQEYPHLTPNAGSEKPSNGTLRVTQDAHIKFTAGSSEDLPTLVHIIQRLAEIPVYSIVNAKEIESTGIDNGELRTRSQRIG